MTENGRVLEHMSCTKFDMLMRCEFAFFKRYVEGIKTKPSGALVFGRADDETKNIVYKSKINIGETAEAHACKEIFAASYEKTLESVDHDVDWGSDDPGKMKDVGVELIGAWRDQVAVKTRPVSVQDEFRFRMPYTHDGEQLEFDFMGYIDLIEEVGPRGERKKVITDNKTAKRKWGKNQAAASTQGVGYGLAAEKDKALQIMGVDPSEVRFHVAVKTKEPKIQHPDEDPNVVCYTSQADRDGFVKQLAKAHLKVSSNLKTGNWVPNGRDSFLCSKRWCGYWQECQREHGGYIKE